MSGQYRCTGVFRDTHYGIILSHGLHFTIQLDASHNAHFETISVARPNNPVMAKPLELDCKMSGGAQADLDGFMAACSKERVSSPLFHFWRHMYGEAQMAKTTPANHLGNVLSQHDIKIEFPEFDASIAAVKSFVQGTDAARAVEAATTSGMDAFDALPLSVRSSMGMYTRESAAAFKRKASGDMSARSAWRGGAGPSSSGASSSSSG